MSGDLSESLASYDRMINEKTETINARWWEITMLLSNASMNVNEWPADDGIADPLLEAIRLISQSAEDAMELRELCLGEQRAKVQAQKYKERSEQCDYS